ncbi:MAG: flagellar biosynthesis regulator FlhF [Melioribacteraceae bacterium]|nr:MAG: flagellar biosynthesis regulator FlhF [Melioribacteraceae bacterium]
MKVKKFVAPTLKDASDQIKHEMGQSAVILGTRILEPDGVKIKRKMFEVTAGLEDDKFNEVMTETPRIDVPENEEEKSEEEERAENVFNELAELTKNIYRKRNDPESSVPNIDAINKKLKEEHKNFQVQQEIEDIEATLLHREIQKPIVNAVIDYLKENIKHLTPSNIDNYVVSNLASMISTRTFELDKKKKPHKIAFVGPTGVGKTTCLAKLATISKILHNLDVGIISADTYRLGAIDQLKIFSEIIDIDLLVAYEPHEMDELLKKFRKKDLILIDTAGRSQHKVEQLAKTKEFLDEIELDDTYLVLSSTSTTKNLYDVADKFRLYNYNSFVFTKVDESAAFGNILNVATKFNNVPVIYLTNGQVIPDDIISAESTFIANMIYTGKISS